MGNTAHGLPYPEPGDPVTNGDDAIKALAQALDPIVPTVVRKTADQAATGTGFVDDLLLKVSLPPGTYRVDAFILAIGPQASDIKTTWTFSGTLSGNHRHCIGPGGSATDLTVGVANMVARAITGIAFYATDPAVSAAIYESLHLIVTATGILQFRWGQNTAATDTTVQVNSRLYPQKVA